MVHDADVAITLLNQLCTGDSSDVDFADILREGQLSFDLMRCSLSTEQALCDGGVELECIRFDDDSRALRLCRNIGRVEFTPWIACPPLKCAAKQYCV